jgi:hypothetical protein
MSETTVTVIGMIVAFLTAFLAEPVKSYFQNRAKLHNLRNALYKELIYNYVALSQYIEQQRAGRGVDYGELTQHLIRTECYKNALQNELSLFYQLDEANRINLFHGSLTRIIASASSEIEDSTLSHFAVSLACNGFLKLFESGIYKGSIDKNTVRQLLSKTAYQEIMARGKVVTEAKESEPVV